MKKLIGLFASFPRLGGFTLGIAASALLASTTFFQTWEMVPARNNTLQVNAGWAIIISGCVGVVLARFAEIKTYVGKFLAFANLATVIYLTVHMGAMMVDPTGRILLFFPVILGFMLAHPDLTIFSEPTAARIINE